MLSPQQREIYSLKQQGHKNSEIAKIIGTTESNIKTQLAKIRSKIKMVTKGGENDPSQYPCALFEDQNLEKLLSEVPGAPRMTVNQLQVLSMAGKGLTVKQVAQQTGKTEKSVRRVLERTGVSTKEFTKRKLTAEERERVEKIKPPAEKRISWTDAALLRAYTNGEIARDHLAGVEVVLRAKGYIRRTPNINRANARNLKTIIAGSREKVLRIPVDKAKAAAADMVYNNAKLLYSMSEFEYENQEADNYSVYSVSAGALENILKAL